MKYAQLNKNNVYTGKVDEIPGDIPGSWYLPNNMCIADDPPTDEPGKWEYDDGEWLELTTEKKAEWARQQRDALLSVTDYLMMPDYPISDTDRDALRAYRQALRDIPEQPSFPDEVAWPEKA